MLSESERRRLDELETFLKLNDPKLVRRFDHPRSPRRWLVLIVVLGVLGVATGVFGFAANVVAAAVVGLCVVALALALALTRTLAFRIG